MNRTQSVASSATKRVEWKCAVCRAIGVVDVRAEASEGERQAFLVAAHQVKQPRCAGTPTLHAGGAP
jgi:hypothetical protein